MNYKFTQGQNKIKKARFPQFSKTSTTRFPHLSPGFNYSNIESWHTLAILSIIRLFHAETSYVFAIMLGQVGSIL